MIDPLRELLLPFGDRQAPLRIAGHDAALAQGEPAGIEPGVDALCERQQRAALRVIGGLKNQRVVLVGGERLFHAAFRAERQPAPAQPGKP